LSEVETVHLVLDEDGLPYTYRGPRPGERTLPVFTDAGRAQLTANAWSGGLTRYAVRQVSYGDLCDRLTAWNSITHVTLYRGSRPRDDGQHVHKYEFMERLI
jgi:hypothetical protein